jgi:hypothetical protein
MTEISTWGKKAISGDYNQYAFPLEEYITLIDGQKSHL